MAVRVAASAAVAAVATAILVTAWSPKREQVRVADPVPSNANPQPAPPRMFSSWYAESLRDILAMEAADVARLEQQLAANPHDFPARLQVMAYYQRADQSGSEESRARRVRHALWLIEHHPDSELLHSPVSHFSQGELRSEEYRRAVALWDRAAKSRPADPAIQWNAASFFAGLDPARHLQYLEATATADPNHPFAIRPLAHLYALALLEQGPLAARAQAGLEGSKNVWVLGNAAYVLQSLHNQSLQMAAPNPKAAELAERYFLRAKALKPDLDRKAILPQLDFEAIARARQLEQQTQQAWEARAGEAAGNIRRLPIEAFPELPPTVSGTLRARKCKIPQPADTGAPWNVIRGEFFAKGESGWAVLCSVDHSTSLLVFRNAHDTTPEMLSTSDDLGYLQELGGNRIGYSRAISTVDRDFIMRHYRAYGGPEPPPIDHHGIDDAFLEKASVTWYYYGGKWLQLQGAD